MEKPITNKQEQIRIILAKKKVLETLIDFHRENPEATVKEVNTALMEIINNNN